MKNNQKGFTLLELLVTIGMFSLVIGYFTLFFSNEIRVYYSKDNDIELKQDGRIAIDRLVSKIRSKNGLSFISRPDDTIEKIYEGSNIVVNTEKNPPVDEMGEISFTFSDAKGYGELVDKEGNRIIGNISGFVITKRDIEDHSLVKIAISCKSGKTASVKEYTTAVRAYGY